MINNQSWPCPYCGYLQIFSDKSARIFENMHHFVKISEHGDVGLKTVSIACLNLQCQKLTLMVSLAEVIRNAVGDATGLSPSPKKEWPLLPDSMAKLQPEYIPEALRQDYEEACQIAHLSPKAAATLARRCLQGMIRDFCKIPKKRNLKSEIEELKNQFEKHQSPHGVTMESIKAIDDVRKIGNIGAHMEKEINIIVDIEPEEATLLINLIEMLFKEWYIAKHERAERLQDIQQTAIEKKQQSKKSADKSKEEDLPSDMG